MKEFIYDMVTRFASLLPRWRKAKIIDEVPELVWTKVTAPINVDMLPEQFNSQLVRAKNIPARRIFVLQNVMVTGEGAVFKNLRVFLPSLPWLRDLDTYQKGELLLRQWMRREKIIHTKRAALIYDQWCTCNYYHWMIESLPRLLLIRENYPDATIILPDEPMEYIKATVQMMRVDNILYVPDRHFLQVKELIFPEVVYYNGVENEDSPPENYSSIQQHNPLYERELITTVRERLLQNFPVKSKPIKKIYVSRSRAAIRRLINEKDILSILERYQFEIVFFEEMTFYEQVRLMLQTSVLAGVHGANMVNILFLQPGAKVIELMNESYVNDAYYLLASSINIPYYSVPCRMATELNQPNPDTVSLNNADLRVDVKAFEKTLRLAVGEFERVI